MVPTTGSQDFARTIDYYTNPGTLPVTTTVTLVGNLGSDANTHVFATSSGDLLPSVADEWFGTDGGLGTTAVITVVHGPAGLLPILETLIGDNIEWTYNLTVPAGQTVELGTFTIQANSEAVAEAEATALVTTTGFGGQAATGLSPTDLKQLDNFVFANVVASLDNSGNLVLADTNPGGPNDNLTIQADTANSRYIIHDPNNQLAPFGYPLNTVASQPDEHTIYVPFSAVTGGSILFNPQGPADTLTVDYSLGSFAAPGKMIQFNGQSGSSNILDVTGGIAFSQEQFDDTGPQGGDVQVTNAAGTSTIDYANVSLVNSTSTATNVTLNLPTGAGAVVEAAAGDLGFDDIRSNGGPGFASTGFANPAGLLTVNTVGGSSLVELAAMDNGFAPATETFSGQAGDMFQLTAANAVSSGSILSLTTATFDLGGNSDTLGALIGNGTILNNGKSAATLTLDGNRGAETFNGILEDGIGGLALSVTGTGTQILLGTNSYSGATTISAGTLQIGNGGTTGTLARGLSPITARCLSTRAAASAWPPPSVGRGR